MAEGYEPIPYGGDNTKKTVIAEIKVGTQSGTVPANANNVSMTANVPSGYTFLCWVWSWSIGWIGTVYSTWPTGQTCDFFVAGGDPSSSRNIEGIFFYYKTTTVSA